MKTKLTALAFVALCTFSTITSCQNQKAVTETTTPKFANNVYGIYRGTIPCADCPGIKTTVSLETDNTFKIASEYLGDEGGKSETTGNFSWDKSGTKIILKSAKEETQFLVGDGTLTQLDKSGNKIEGANAQFYLFTRGNYEIVNKQWTLVELMGKPVDASKTMKKEAFIIFNDDNNRYNASAGCNGISGTFATESFNKLRLGAGMSTMMACPDMTLEDEFSKVLNQADSFIIKGDELMLVKGRMAPLAKFKRALQK